MSGIRAVSPVSATAAAATVQNKDRAADKAEFKEKFAEVLGGTMYGMMFKAMRKSMKDNPYFNGGQAEQMFGQQLDQLLAEKMARRDASKFSSLSALENLPRK
jgi:hypothetical protein